MNIWPKLYTREFPLLLCEIWGKGYSSFFGIKPKIYPIYIFILKDGLVEAYRNPEATHDINNIYSNKKKEDNSFVKDFYEESLDKFNELEKEWKRENLNKEELISFYNKLIKFWDSMYASMYLPYNPELFSKEELDLMIKLRAKIDITADEATKIITKSLNNIYPKLNNLVLYISIEDLKRDEIDKNLLIKRSKKELVMVDGEIIKEDLDNIKDKYNFELEEINVDKKVNEIKGSIAFKGIIRGRVKLILRREEISSIKEGDILVSTMTIPDFMPAMKKASAFVTDEGGITCHAAIIAREMKKPCIIGTKIATKVLKDGDLVEVDADSGLVRIIKRAD